MISSPVSILLDEFPVVKEIEVEWHQLDAAQHVNNVVYLRWFETARIEYMARLGYVTMEQVSEIGPVVASLECKYISPVFFPDRVSLGVRVTEVREDRFLMQCHIVSHAQKKLAAIAHCVIVTYDHVKKQKQQVPEEARQRIAQLEARAAGR